MDAMSLAIEEARKTMNENIGGPFGAAITDKKGNIIVVTSNRVLETNDPTAHAEIVAIREATKKLGTRDLSEYILYATGYPCPMCLSAIIWSNIKKVYYASNLEDAEKINFKDKTIYEYLSGKNTELLDVEHLEESREDAVKLFEEYKNNSKEIY